MLKKGPELDDYEDLKPHNLSNDDYQPNLDAQKTENCFEKNKIESPFSEKLPKPKKILNNSKTGVSCTIKSKKQAAALAILKDFLEIEKKRRKPKILWFASGCLLLIIIIIILSTIVPLLLMISDAKDIVKKHLKHIQDNEFDQAYAMCDKEFFAQDLIIKRISEFADAIKTQSLDEDFIKFADSVLKEKTKENYQQLLNVLQGYQIPSKLSQEGWQQTFDKSHLHDLTDLCDVETLAKEHFTEIYDAFYKVLKKGSFVVQKFSTAQKQASVQGEIVHSSGKIEFFNYVLYYDNDTEIWVVIRFGFVEPEP